MNTVKVFAILAALLLTSAEFLVMDYDARQRAAHYSFEGVQATQRG